MPAEPGPGPNPAEDGAGGHVARARLSSRVSHMSRHSGLTSNGEDGHALPSQRGAGPSVAAAGAAAAGGGRTRSGSGVVGMFVARSGGSKDEGDRAGAAARRRGSSIFGGTVGRPSGASGREGASSVEATPEAPAAPVGWAAMRAAAEAAVDDERPSGTYRPDPLDPASAPADRGAGAQPAQLQPEPRDTQ